jgi:hypothetical protein
LKDIITMTSNIRNQLRDVNSTLGDQKSSIGKLKEGVEVTQGKFGNVNEKL